MIHTEKHSYRHWSDAEAAKTYLAASTDAMHTRWSPKFCEVTPFDLR